MENELPKRKHPRLKNYDYDSAGAYFITICTKDRKCILARIQTDESYVGRGSHARLRAASPAENVKSQNTLYGEIAEKNIFFLEQKYNFVKIDKYVIMPNHIHMVVSLDSKTAGDAAPLGACDPRPTIIDIIGIYKLKTAKECQKNGLKDKLFQSSFYEHVIRNKEDYENSIKYISENPLKWALDELYEEI